jgi:hypothetical protein
VQNRKISTFTPQQFETMTPVTSSKRDNIIFWVSTALFCAFMLTSAIPNILSGEQWVTIFKQLGYPAYLLPFLGVAKLLALLLFWYRASHDSKNGHMQVSFSISSAPHTQRLLWEVLIQ